MMTPNKEFLETMAVMLAFAMSVVIGAGAIVVITHFVVKFW